ncbi:MAG: DUF3592 domain-containing protein [Planctomycetota bacterium]
MAVDVDAARLRNMWESHTDLPRNVPLGLRLAVLLGGSLSQVGWLMVLVGMISAYCLVDFGAVRWWFGTIAETSGTYNGSEGTNAEVNDVPVYRHKFTFEIDGETIHGQSYTTGSSSPPSTCTIEYLAGNPDAARIKGQRTGMFGGVVMFVLIFPLIGVCMLVRGTRYGARASRLLAVGKTAQATLVSKEATGTKINDQTVYKYTFRFVDEAGQEQTVVSKTHTGELEDDSTETVLYDPSNPANACTVDNLPGRPVIEQGGTVRAGSRVVMLTLILPTLVLAGLIMWAAIG